MLNYNKLTNSIFASPKKKNLSTGLPELDSYLVNGLPKGKVIELSGPSDSGKTAFSLHLIKQVQEQEGIAILANIDNNANMGYMQYADIDPDKAYIFSSNSISLLISYIKSVAASNAADLLIIDSITNLISEKEMNSSMKETQNSLNYGLIGRMLSEISTAIDGTNLCVLCINQYRARRVKERYVKGSAWQKLFKVYTTARMTLQKESYVEDDGDIIGFNSKIIVTDNKLNDDIGDVIFPVYFTKQVKE